MKFRGRWSISPWQIFDFHAYWSKWIFLSHIATKKQMDVIKVRQPRFFLRWSEFIRGLPGVYGDDWKPVGNGKHEHGLMPVTCFKNDGGKSIPARPIFLMIIQRFCNMIFSEYRKHSYKDVITLTLRWYSSAWCGFTNSGMCLDNATTVEISDSLIVIFMKLNWINVS